MRASDLLPALPSASVGVPVPAVVARSASAAVIDVAGRRLGRSAFGAALIIGAVALVVSALTHGDMRAVIAFSFWGACCAYVVGRVAGAARQRHLGDVPSDELLAPSLILPMVGLSLLMPLALHALVLFINSSANQFNDWGRISLIIVGHAHIALAVLTGRAAWRVSRGEERMHSIAILAITAGVACVPGIVAWGIPPLAVAVTGAIFVPAMLKAIDAIARKDLAVMYAIER